MPRELNKAQKRILDEHNAMSFDDLPSSAQRRVVALNDYETVYQDADRYLWDKYERAPDCRLREGRAF